MPILNTPLFYSLIGSLITLLIIGGISLNSRLFKSNEKISDIQSDIKKIKEGLLRLQRGSKYNLFEVSEEYDYNLEYRKNIENSLQEEELIFGVEISRSAKDLIILSLLEIEYLIRLRDLSASDYKFEEWPKSIHLIIKTAFLERAYIDKENNTLTTASIIQAFARTFCNIPPFCRQQY